MNLTQILYWGGFILLFAFIPIWLHRRERRYERRRRIIAAEKKGPAFVCHPDNEFHKKWPVGKTFTDERTDEQLVAGHQFEQVKVLAPNKTEVGGIWKYKCKNCGFTVLRHSPLKLTTDANNH